MYVGERKRGLREMAKQGNACPSEGMTKRGVRVWARGCIGARRWQGEKRGKGHTVTGRRETKAGDSTRAVPMSLGLHMAPAPLHPPSSSLIRLPPHPTFLDLPPPPTFLDLAPCPSPTHHPRRISLAALLPSPHLMSIDWRFVRAFSPDDSAVAPSALSSL